MALFKDIETIKKFVETSINLDLEDFLPSINLAELKIKNELIGAAQYDALHTAYQAAASDAALTAENLALINAVRFPAANYALALAMPRLQVMVSGKGVQINSNENQKTAFAWQVNDAVDSYNAAGDVAADQLLDFLETNKATYTLWSGSTMYTVFKDCYVNTTALFDSLRRINNSRRVFLALKPSMHYVQDTYITGTIGTGYAAELMAEILSGTITTPNLVPMDYIRKAVAYLSSSVSLAEMVVSVTPEGVLVINSSNADQPRVKNYTPTDKYGELVRTWKEKGETYVRKLRDHLNANASSSMYATYFASGKYQDPATVEGRFKNEDTHGVGLF